VYNHHLSRRTRINVLQLGEHIITARGKKSFVAPAFDRFCNGPVLEPIIVEGSSVTIQHPQHESITESIPEGYYAVIVSQRGRIPIQVNHEELD
jgi:hypothetical protein